MVPVPVVPRWLRPRLVELGLAWVFFVAWSGVAVAAPPEVRLEATAELGTPPEDRAPFEEALVDAVRRGVGAAGVVEQAEAPARLVVELAWEDERRIDYVGTIEVRRVDAPEAEPLVIRGFGCEMCGAGDLFGRVESEVALALAAVDWAAAAPVPPKPGVAAVGHALPADDADPVRRRPRLHRLSAAGLGVAGLGVVSGVVGAVLWAREDRIELRPEDPEGPVWKRSYRPPGIALVATGVGAVLAGATLVAVDLARARRRDVAVGPMLAPGFAGLRVKGCF